MGTDPVVTHSLTHVPSRSLSLSRAISLPWRANVARRPASAKQARLGLCRSLSLSRRFTRCHTVVITDGAP